MVKLFREVRTTEQAASTFWDGVLSIADNYYEPWYAEFKQALAVSGVVDEADESIERHVYHVQQIEMRSRAINVEAYKRFIFMSHIAALSLMAVENVFPPAVAAKILSDVFRNASDMDKYFAKSRLSICESVAKLLQEYQMIVRSSHVAGIMIRAQARLILADLGLLKVKGVMMEEADEVAPILALSIITSLYENTVSWKKYSTDYKVRV